MKDKLAPATFVLALLSFIWSYHLNNKILPLNKSQLILYPEKDKREIPINDNTRAISVLFKLKNVGKSPAKNINYSLYSVYYDNDQQKKCSVNYPL